MVKCRIESCEGEANVWGYCLEHEANRWEYMEGSIHFDSKIVQTAGALFIAIPIRVIRANNIRKGDIGRVIFVKKEWPDTGVCEVPEAREG